MPRRKVVKLSQEEYDILSNARVLLMKKGTERLCPNIEIEDFSFGAIIKVIAGHVIKKLKETE